MKVLVACEYSGVVRDAFLGGGHEVMSCDLLPTDVPGPHHQGDLFDVIDYPWDLVIAHPPCTHLSVSGSRHFAEKKMDGRQQSAVSFFMRLVRQSAHIPMVAIENPVCIMSSLYRKPDQIIQPWQFGHGETKATCLWLKGLPILQPTNIVNGREARVHRMPPSPDRWKERSKTFRGVAEAMASQWGSNQVQSEPLVSYHHAQAPLPLMLRRG
jgi:site-specific DNA-cytosine methylase